MLAILFLPQTILIVAAVIPAFFLIRKVYQLDHLEPESGHLIVSLILWGIVSTFFALILERLGSFVLSFFFEKENLLYNILMYFGIVAFAEEGSKLVVLRNRTWNDPEFNCQFDGIVYAVTVSLGFALWENISYVFQFGLGTALVRAITAVPGHACFGVFMGVWYGLSRRFANRGFLEGEKTTKVLTLLCPALVHGAYDFICIYEPALNYGPLAFLAFILSMFLLTRKILLKASQHDRFI